MKYVTSVVQEHVLFRAKDDITLHLEHGNGFSKAASPGTPIKYLRRC